MKIVIAGAGAVGTHLSKLLSGENQNVWEACRNMT